MGSSHHLAARFFASYRIVPCRTVANVLSLRLIVRKCNQRPAATSQDQVHCILVRPPGQSIQDLSLSCRKATGLGLTRGREIRKIKAQEETGRVKRPKGYLFIDE
jgi:hypothetical protein